jgi:hypothetical protein
MGIRIPGVDLKGARKIKAFAFEDAVKEYRKIKSTHNPKNTTLKIVKSKDLKWPDTLKGTRYKVKYNLQKKSKPY